ncbi:MAG TPA: MATE family efflux transporter [Dermatophilaceae bacterium]|nr:MATE family efflux transporter [Dermatophilaceae bacterium]
MPGHRQSDRRAVLRLAVPAFLALVAEPLFLLADSAIVGHLGTASLAGLGIASAGLVTAANVFVFLAYGTTAVVARRTGAGDTRGAVAAGIDGVWLAVLLGTATGVAVAVAAEPIGRVLGASAGVLDQATTYLRISAAGVPGMLVVLAATGVLRGLQDTRTPLVAAVLGFGANIGLNLFLVYGLRLGIAGSALGTVLAQSVMAAGLFAVVARKARWLGAPLRPHSAGVLTAAVGGIPLLVRTLALRAVLLLTTWAAAGLGDVPLAAYQVSATVWSFLAFALDALASAAQALTGHALGGNDVATARSATSLMVRWGVGAGVVLGVLLLLVHRLLPPLFTGDPAVQAALAAGLVVVAIGQPLSGYVFVLDGVLIGAGDGRWLAGAQTVVLAAYLPMVAWAREFATSLPQLWLAFTGFMAVRAVALGWRARGDGWLVTGTLS